MSDDDQKHSVTISISDVLGAGAATKTLLGMIERGASWILTPAYRKRIDNAQRQIAGEWVGELAGTGLSIKAATLDIGDQAVLHLQAEAVRRSGHREAVANAAIEEFRRLAGDDVGKATIEEIDLEWVDMFWRLAEDIGSLPRQALWGRILARKARGSEISARTLHALSMLSGEEAALLEKLARYVVRYVRGAPNAVIMTRLTRPFEYVPHGKEQAAREIMGTLRRLIGEVGIDLLEPIGFLSGVDDYSMFLEIVDQEILFSIGGTEYAVRPVERLIEPDRNSEDLRFGEGYRLTRMGREVFSLVGTEPDNDYVRLLARFMRLSGWEMVTRDRQPVVSR